MNYLSGERSRGSLCPIGKLVSDFKGCKTGFFLFFLVIVVKEKEKKRIKPKSTSSIRTIPSPCGGTEREEEKEESEDKGGALPHKERIFLMQSAAFD